MSFFSKTILKRKRKNRRLINDDKSGKTKKTIRDQAG